MTVRILQGDVLAMLKTLPDESIHCAVTSPPYWGLRSYLPQGHADKHMEIGQEPTLADHIEVMVNVFREVRRVLRSDGVLFLNYGDAYAGTGKSGGGSDGARRGVDGYGATALQGKGTWQPPTDNFKPKDLMLMPSRLAIALQDDGWWVRSKIIWHKPNPMPESVTDRPTSSYEEILLLTKSGRYFYDAEAVKETAITNDMRRPYGSEGAWQLDGRPAEQRHGGKLRASARDAPNEAASRNMRNVWTVATQPFSEAHFATFPAELAERCIKAGSSERGCCSKCGTPWVRNIVRSEEVDESHKGSRFDKGKTVARDGGERTQNGERFKKVASGWSAGCECGADVVPCVVLDQFGGSGTTGLVADRLGRNAVLIELNSKYATMAERRIKRDAPLFAEVACD